MYIIINEEKCIYKHYAYLYSAPYNQTVLYKFCYIKRSIKGQMNLPPLNNTSNTRISTKKRRSTVQGHNS